MTWLLLLLYGGRPQMLMIRDGRVEVRKGKIPHSLTRAAQEVIELSGLRFGAIYRNHDGRWGFSLGMPPEVRQRLRNVLASR